jgi:hypothetical protein
MKSLSIGRCNSYKILLWLLWLLLMMMMMMMMMIVHQEPAIKCGLPEGPSVPYYKYELQSMLESSIYRLCYDRSITTDRSIHNNRPYIIIRDKTIKKAY